MRMTEKGRKRTGIPRKFEHLIFRWLLRAVVVSGVSWMMTACNVGSNEFTMGSEFIDGGSTLTMIDTFQIKMSTVLIDSLNTSNTGTALVGHYVDPNLGTVTATSYFELGIPTSFSESSGNVYDSTVVILRYNGYYYGDTTRWQTITVHSIAERLNGNEWDNGIYNNRNTPYSSEVLGSVHFLKRTAVSDSLVIPISDTLGKDFFTRMNEGDDDYMTSSSSLVNYFHGLAIVPDTTESNVVYGFKADATNLAMRVYYHRPNANGDGQDDYYADFPYTSVDPAYNRIQADRSQTLLKSLVTQREDISSTSTDGETFVQCGTGLMTKMRFPSLNDIQLINQQGIIMKAELEFSPVVNTYDPQALPDSLILIQTNKVNAAISTLTSSDGTTLHLSPSSDELYNENTKFTIDITDFIQNAFSDGLYNTENGLLISWGSTQYLSRLDGLVIQADQKVENGPKLKIYYMTF